MKLLAYLDLYDPYSLLDDTGSELKLPAQQLGKELALSMRFYDRIGGQKVEKDIDIRSLNATVGKMGIPEAGDWKMLVGEPPLTVANTTVALPLKVTAAKLAEAINALTAAGPYGTCTGEDKGDCTWVLTFAGNTGPVPLKGASLTFVPRGVVRVRAFLKDGVWRHEVRLLRAPIAAAAVAARLYPEAPTVERIQAGATESGFQNNEVQVLTVPLDFRGTYTLRKGFQKTAALDRTDFAEDIQAALEAKFGEGNFKVTNPTTGQARIEFQGDFAGLAMDLLIAEVETAPPGDWTVRLSFDNSDAAEALRTTDEDEFILEIDAMIAEPGDAGDFPGRPALLLSIPITLKRELRFKELTLTTPLDWLSPVDAATVLPFNPSMVGVGQTPYSTTLGDGATTHFVVVHNRNTQVLTGYVCIDKATKRVLVLGTDYTAYATSPNSVTLDFAVAPGVAGDTSGVFFAMSTPQSLAVALLGLHIAVGNVDGLQGLLDDFGSRLEAVEAVLPTTAPGTTQKGTAATWTKPDTMWIFPRAQDRRVQTLLASLKPTTGDTPGLPAVDESKLPAAPYLLPAIHYDPSYSWDGSPLPDPNEAAHPIYLNEGDSIEIDGGNGLPTSTVPFDSFFGHDSRMWFPVTRRGTTRSYYPTAFERTLFQLDVNEHMLAAGSTLELTFSVALQLLKANVAASCALVIQFGEYQQQTYPPPVTGPNLTGINWATTPLEQIVDISADAVTHRFGVRIKRTAEATTCDALYYANWLAAAGIPPAPAFAIRARLKDFDPGDDDTAHLVDPDYRGYLFGALIGAKATITS
jgi:hypothetical protein